jgi:uncharacterized protein YeaO (DUF488 family)
LFPVHIIDPNFGTFGLDNFKDIVLTLDSNGRYQPNGANNLLTALHQVSNGVDLLTNSQVRDILGKYGFIDDLGEFNPQVTGVRIDRSVLKEKETQGKKAHPQGTSEHYDATFARIKKVWKEFVKDYEEKMTDEANAKRKELMELLLEIGLQYGDEYKMKSLFHNSKQFKSARKLYNDRENIDSIVNREIKKYISEKKST